MRTLRDQLWSRNSHRRMFGLPSQQTAASMVLYEQLCREFRQSIKWIHEVGTGDGGLSLWFAVWAKLNDIPFDTVDIVRSNPKTAECIRALGGMAWTSDAFTFTPKKIPKVITGLLFLDGGDKPRELREFAPLTAPGTLILVHDYGEEILDADIEAVDCVDFLEPWQAMTNELNAHVAVLRKK